MPLTPIRKHGRDHRPGGQDPIGGGAIAYDLENVGGWLEITTTSHGGDANIGIFLNDTEATGGGIIIATAGNPGISLNSTNGAISLNDYGTHGILLGENGAGSITIVDNAGGGGISIQELSDAGLNIENQGTATLAITQSGGNDPLALVSNAGISSTDTSGDGIQIQEMSDGGIQIYDTNLGRGNTGGINIQTNTLLQLTGEDVTIEVAPAIGMFTNGNLTINNLPTTNPGGTGRVWNNSGTLQIT